MNKHVKCLDQTHSFKEVVRYFIFGLEEVINIIRNSYTEPWKHKDDVILPGSSLKEFKGEVSIHKTWENTENVISK